MDLIGFWFDGIWPLLTNLSSVGPLATFFVALAAWLTYRQKMAADARDQWWQRAEWAIGLALKDDRESRLAGLVAISELSASTGATAEDEKLFRSVSTSVTSEVRKRFVQEAPPRRPRGLFKRTAGQ